MHSKSNNMETIINDESGKVMEELFNHFLIDMKMDWKHQ